ncbi:MAG TPA: hypothetical protein PLL78_13800 [Fimbriimonadaceae bacterium]|nr:hypothetical protein [Fimbriimonadaceae bacterium]HRJ97749.1 hypothetical protein [Fimbriimonadaceae bacterium]
MIARILRALGALFVIGFGFGVLVPPPAVVVDSVDPMLSVSKLRALVEKEQEEKRASGKKEADAGYLAGWLEYLMFRAYPYDTVDWETLDAEAEKASKLAADQRDRLGVQADIWTYDGPENMGSGGGAYFGPNPVAGRVSALAYSPDGNTIYAGSPSGGLFKATDSSAWTRLSKDWTYQAVSAVAIKPDNARVILVGTGDFAGGRPLGACGIKRSTDGGQTWTDVIEPFGKGRPVSAIVFDPEDPTIVLACSGRGAARDANGRLTGNGRIFRSTNAGATWQAVAGTPAAIWSSIAVGALSATTGRRLYYASAISPKGELWRSADKGRTWEKLPTLLADREYDCVKVAASPTEPGNVYLMSGIHRTTPLRRAVHRSKAGGKPLGSWEVIDIGLFNTAEEWNQCRYDSYIACTTYRRGEENRDVLFVGLKDLFVSMYANTARVADFAWESAGLADQNTAKIHYDQQCMTFKPGVPAQGFAGCDGGLYKLTIDFATPGFTFQTAFNEVLPIAEIYRGDWRATGGSPTIANRTLVGMQDNQTAFYNSLNLDWPNACNTGDGHGVGILGIVPGGGALGDVQAASGYQDGGAVTFYRTEDQWGTRPPASKDVTFVRGSSTLFFPPMAIANAHDEMYVGSTYLHRSIDDGAWTEIGVKAARGPDKPLATNALSAIAVAPSDHNIVYVGGFDGELWRSTNRGANDSWTAINKGTPARPVTHIAVDPRDPKRVVVCFGGNTDMRWKVWRCEDTTVRLIRWSQISGVEDTAGCLPNVQANCAAIDPDNSDYLYVGTDIGFYYTRTNGRVWKDGTRNLGLPVTQVNSVKVLGNGRNARIYLATYGAGTWYTTYNELP